MISGADIMCGAFILFVITSVFIITIQQSHHTEDLPDYWEGDTDVSAYMKDLPVSCSEREILVEKPQRESKFCRPELVNPTKVQKLRLCICKPGYVRNSWDRCIYEHECRRCKALSNEDYNDFCVCAYKCDRPVNIRCQGGCKVGCDCAPGFSRDHNDTCVPISECPPICPVNSTFELCKSGCEPLCRLAPPKKDCVPSCNKGHCICKDGYAMEAGVCLPWKNCPKE